MTHRRFEQNICIVDAYHPVSADGQGRPAKRKGCFVGCMLFIGDLFRFWSHLLLETEKNCFDRERAISGAWELPLIWHKKIFFMVDIAWIWMAHSSRILSVWKCPWNNFGLREKSGHSKKKKKTKIRHTSLLHLKR